MTGTGYHNLPLTRRIAATHAPTHTVSRQLVLTCNAIDCILILDEWSNKQLFRTTSFYFGTNDESPLRIAKIRQDNFKNNRLQRTSAATMRPRKCLAPPSQQTFPPCTPKNKNGSRQIAARRP